MCSPGVGDEQSSGASISSEDIPSAVSCPKESPTNNYLTSDPKALDFKPLPIDIPGPMVDVAISDSQLLAFFGKPDNFSKRKIHIDANKHKFAHYVLKSACTIGDRDFDADVLIAKYEKNEGSDTYKFWFRSRKSKCNI